MEAHPGLNLAHAAMACSGLIRLANGGREASLARAQRERDWYYAEARLRGVADEDAEKILAMAHDNQHLVGDPYHFATAALALMITSPATPNTGGMDQ
jgi:hypothetical protein